VAEEGLLHRLISRCRRVRLRSKKRTLIFTGAVAPAEVKATRKHKGYFLTDEQDLLVDFSLTGSSLKIEVFAGAGKISTLSAIGSAIPAQKGLYLAFRKSIATDAVDSFPAG